MLDVRIDAPGDTPVVERVHTGKYRCKDWTPEIAVSSNVERLREQLRALDENDAFLQDAAHAAMRDADTQTIGGGGEVDRIEEFGGVVVGVALRERCVQQ